MKEASNDAADDPETPDCCTADNRRRAVPPSHWDNRPTRRSTVAAAPATRRSRLLTVSDLSDRLRLSKATIYSLVCRKRIDHYKLGSRVLFDERHVEAYLSMREETRLGFSTRSGRR